MVGDSFLEGDMAKFKVKAQDRKNYTAIVDAVDSDDAQNWLEDCGYNGAEQVTTDYEETEVFSVEEIK